MNHEFKPHFLLLAVAVTLPAMAQTPEISLGRVEVNRIPRNDGRQRVRRRRSDPADAAAATSDTASLLRDVPGVSLYGAGGVSSLPAIHGLADDRLRIKVDGMDLIASCPNHMNPALSYIDPTNVGSAQGLCRHRAGQRRRRQHRRHHRRRNAGAGVRRARPGQPDQGRGRRVLPQQRQCDGRQPLAPPMPPSPST